MRRACPMLGRVRIRRLITGERRKCHRDEGRLPRCGRRQRWTRCWSGCRWRTRCHCRSWCDCRHAGRRRGACTFGRGSRCRPPACVFVTRHQQHGAHDDHARPATVCVPAHGPCPLPKASAGQRGHPPARWPPAGSRQRGTGPSLHRAPYAYRRGDLALLYAVSRVNGKAERRRAQAWGHPFRPTVPRRVLLKAVHTVNGCCFHQTHGQQQISCAVEGRCHGDLYIVPRRQPLTWVYSLVIDVPNVP